MRSSLEYDSQNYLSKENQLESVVFLHLCQYRELLAGLLDACYFHKTPIPFPGDGEDIEVTSLRSSHTLTNQRGLLLF